VEIRRFGIGHRRHEGPPGTHGLDGQSIHADHRGAIAELAFRPNAAMAPHSNPNLTYFVVIEGGGFVQVGDERARVAAGEAVVWPPDVVHAAWTEHTPMRALVVEFAVGDAGPLLIEAGAVELAVGSALELVVEPEADPAGPAVPAEGGLSSEPGARPHDHDSTAREPW
jgi:quercetin dioxygenase-like cupin family protein